MGWWVGERSPEVIEPRAQAGDSAVAGTRWVTLSKVGGQGTRLVASVVLARLLVPEDFGLMAMVGLVTTAFDWTIGQNVTGSALIHRTAVSSRMASSVFFLNIGVGLAIGAGIFFGAPWFAWLVGDERTTDLFRAVALLPVIMSSGFIHRALLRRSFRFARFAVVQYSFAGIHAVVAIPLAVLGFGVWSLVIGSLVGAVGATALSWLLSPWRPLLHFRLAEVKQLAGYSSNLGLANLFGFGSEYGDRYIIGRFVGTAALGFYNLAFRLLLYPLKLTVTVVVDVLFPVFARMQDDTKAVARGYVRAASLAMAGVLPAMAGLAIVAEPVVRAVLGPRWLPAVPIVTVIALAAPITVLATSATCLYFSSARTGTLLGVTAGHSIVTVTAYVIGARWGAVGVAWGYFAAEAITLYPRLAIPFRFVDLDMRPLLTALAPAAAATAAMAVVVGAARILLEQAGWGSWAMIGVCVPLGIATYVAPLYSTRPPVVDDFFKVVQPGRGRRQLHRAVGVTEAGA